MGRLGLGSFILEDLNPYGCEEYGGDYEADEARHDVQRSLIHGVKVMYFLERRMSFVVRRFFTLRF